MRTGIQERERHTKTGKTRRGKETNWLSNRKKIGNSNEWDREGDTKDTKEIKHRLTNRQKDRTGGHIGHRECNNAGQTGVHRNIRQRGEREVLTNGKQEDMQCGCSSVGQNKNVAVRGHRDKKTGVRQREKLRTGKNHRRQKRTP